MYLQDAPAPAGYRWIYVPRFRHWRSGKIIEAAKYGKQAFRFLVRKKRR
jgi:hypothetical protein